MRASGTTVEGLGGDLFELIASHDIGECPVPKQLGNEQSIVPVNVVLQIVPKPLRTPIRL